MGSMQLIYDKLIPTLRAHIAQRVPKSDLEHFLQEMGYSRAARGTTMVTPCRHDAMLAMELLIVFVWRMASY